MNLRSADFRNLSPEVRAIVNAPEIEAERRLRLSDQIERQIALESQPRAFAVGVGTPDDLSEEETDKFDLLEYLMDHEH
jgi:hypothetical protein